MRITGVRVVPVVGGWYCDDKAALTAGQVETDHHLARGRPRTAGFTAVREVGRGVGIILQLDDGSTAYGDGASVTYAGAAGRDPPFRLDEHAAEFQELVVPWLMGREVSDFSEMADGIEELRWRDSRLHTALRYAISQALLEASAAALACTKAEVLARSLGAEITRSPVRLVVQSGTDRYNAVDKAIYHRVDVFPHGLIQSVDQDLGPTGEKLLEYARWIASRLAEHKVEPEYRPSIHFDSYGAVGRAFSHDLNAITGYLLRLEETVSPLSLQIESPVDMKSQQAQIETLGSLRKSLAARGSRVTLIVDEWCNTLEDVALFARSGAVDMIQVKMPDLGSISQSAKAVLECRRHGVNAYLGGSCNETDHNARNAVHLAVATGPEQVLARPGMGIDEAVSIMRNEEARLRATLG